MKLEKQSITYPSVVVVAVVPSMCGLLDVRVLFRIM